MIYKPATWCFPCVRGVTGLALAVGLGLLAAAPAHAADVFKGRDLYGKHCEICHGPNGKGMLASSPDFTRGQGLLRTDLSLVETIRNGRGVMPAFRGLLSNQEMLDVIAYLRTFQR